MYPLFRRMLFQLDPEAAHGLTLHSIGLAGRLAPTRWLLEGMFTTPEKPVEVLGLRFRNAVGLAAGYDKDGIAVPGLATLGFGHLEIGTVTPRPQEGNPKPRIFRLVEDDAVINRMGFPGSGMEAARRELTRVRQQQGGRSGTGPERTGTGPERTGTGNDIVIGVNLGKNKDTPLEAAAGDYLALLRTFIPLADYLAINISSPNTVGLRRLQGREMLEELLGAIAVERNLVNRERGLWKPVLVKLAPDLSDDELEDALGVILDKGMDGVIATNTTLARQGLRSTLQGENGGLSGKPLGGRSKEILIKVVKFLDGKLPVISVGGIMNPQDAKRRLEMGAALVQVYTGLIYSGPGLVKEMVNRL